MSQASDDLASANFARLLKQSPRILCLVGAGLSAPSGLATWRGANGLWNNLDLKSLASPQTFKEDPVTVWEFYGERLLEALTARPNAAHHALAALATWHDGWVTVNQNVDGGLDTYILYGERGLTLVGLLERTEYPRSRLLSIHGSLGRVRCVACDYNVHVKKPEDLPFLLRLSANDDNSSVMQVSDLPHCPGCGGLLRPGVVWFGERLAAGAPDSVDEWISRGEVDLVITIGTSLRVFPAAEWVDSVRNDGASLAVFELENGYQLVDEWNVGDWLFTGDIELLLPKVMQFVHH